MRGFVLVGGWPGSGKTTLARALAPELSLPLLSKDVVKEALMDALGAPPDVEESRRLGRAAVFAVLAAAQGCPGAVVDSTWYPYARELAERLPGPFVELRCHVPREVAIERFRRRTRDVRHLDHLREPSELWDDEVAPLGLGPVLDVDTSGPVDVARIAAACRVTSRPEPRNPRRPTRAARPAPVADHPAGGADASGEPAGWGHEP